MRCRDGSGWHCACVASVAMPCTDAGRGRSATPRTPTPAAAQTAAASTTGRARIGLVLSGGGARGAAHVGVIRALEEMHIPIDAVAGTSMGAVVGGLYAAGLSGDRDRAGVSARSTGRS